MLLMIGPYSFIKQGKEVKTMETEMQKKVKEEWVKRKQENLENEQKPQYISKYLPKYCASFGDGS